MSKGSRKRRSRRLFGALALLFLLALLLPLSHLLPGFLPGGGRLDSSKVAERDGRRAGTLRVTILRGQDREPLEGAQILVSGLAGGEADLESGPGGQAELAGLGDGPVRVEASAGGLKAVAWANPSTEGEIQLSVVQEPQRTGRVVDTEGRPVSARMRLLGRHGETLAEGRTDERGEYVLPDHPFAVAVCAEPDAAPPTSVERGELAIAGEGERLEGALVGEGGGVLELFGEAPASGQDTLLPFRAQWPVGPDGRFAGLLPKGGRVWARYDGRPLSLESGPNEVPPGAVMRGSVRGPGERPVAGAVLVFRPLLDGGFPARMPGLSVTTDGEGRFDAEGFAQVTYLVEVTATACATLVLDEATPGDAPIEIRLRSGFALHGSVVDDAELPVAGASVHALAMPQDEAEQPILRARADSAGRFDLGGLAGTGARVRVSADGYHPTTIDGVRPGARLRVVLQRR